MGIAKNTNQSDTEDGQTKQMNDTKPEGIERMNRPCPNCGGYEPPHGSEWVPFEDNGAAHTSYFCSKECLNTFKRTI